MNRYSFKNQQCHYTLKTPRGVTAVSVVLNGKRTRRERERVIGRRIMNDLSGLKNGYYHIQDGEVKHIPGMIHGDHFFDFDPKWHDPVRWCIKCQNSEKEHTCKRPRFKWAIWVSS